MAVLGLATVPAIASAADRFVDIDGSDDTPCVLLSCRNVGYAIAQAAPGDRIVVGPGTYNEQVTIGDGKSLVAGTGARPTIDGAAGTAVTVSGPGVVVKGLRLRGDAHGVNVLGLATGIEITDNVLDDAALNPNGKIAVSGGSATVTGNVLPAPAVSTGISRGIIVNSVKPTVIRGNTVANVFAAITVTASGAATPPLVEGNHITGVRGSSPSIGTGIRLTGSGTVAGNVVEGVPVASGFGIRMDDFSVPSTAVSRGNRVLRMSDGAIDAEFSVAGSTLRSTNDILTNSGTAMKLFGGSPVVTGATIYDNAPYDIYLGNSQTALTLRSSLLGAKGVAGQGSCAISFSRGPSTTGTPCQQFQTAVPPVFVGYSDYRLVATSPLIDAGDPAAPAAGEVDFDGLPRAIVGTTEGRCAPPRRDIGAYELAPTPALTCPPVVPTPPGTPPSDPGEKAPVPPTGPTVPTAPPGTPGGAVAVIADTRAALAVAVDGGRSSALAAGAVGPSVALQPGTHRVRITPRRGRLKPVTARAVVRPGELGVLTVSVVGGRLKTVTTRVAKGARRVVSLLPSGQRIRIGKARARSLRHGAGLALPSGAKVLTVGRRRLRLTPSAQLTVLVRTHGRVGTVVRTS